MIRRAARTISTAAVRYDLIGWVFLVIAMGALAVALLVPSQIEVQQMAHHHRRLGQQVESLRAQRDNYESLIASIDRGDANLLTRLAWRELHLKPVGAVPLDDALPEAQADPAGVDQWTVDPDLVVADLAPPPPPDTLLVDLSSGRKRPMLFIAGALLAGCAMLTTLRKPTAPGTQAPP